MQDCVEDMDPVLQVCILSECRDGWACGVDGRDKGELGCRIAVSFGHLVNDSTVL